jgi:hypothetical protein
MQVDHQQRNENQIVNDGSTPYLLQEAQITPVSLQLCMNLAGTVISLCMMGTGVGNWHHEGAQDNVKQLKNWESTLAVNEYFLFNQELIQQ